MDSVLAPFAGALAFVDGLNVALTVLILVEIGLDLVSAVRGRSRRNWRETLVNLGIGVPGALFASLVIAGVTITLLAGVSALSPWSHGTAWWTWPVCFALVDLCYYFGHRLEHRVRVLWAHHSVHHSSEDFDLSTSGRIAWQDGLVTWVYVAPVALLGFHAVQIVVCYQLVLLYQVWVHTQRIPRLPEWFERVFNTPSAHRVHHASNPAYLDRNYGGVFLIWDQMFGTYAVESEEPVRYGLTKPIGSVNPLVVNFAETLGVVRDAARGTAAQRLWSVFGPPEWSREHGLSRTHPDSWWRRLVALQPATTTTDTRAE